MLNNRNWNDRANKDLFFTILSVKNIGVISGSEWSTIGNHMRTMGYGFTNEGCRQHFQGLRRSQGKDEVNSPAVAPSDAPMRADPTMNPITRRPGPGRGRPRKSQIATEASGSPASATQVQDQNMALADMAQSGEEQLQSDQAAQEAVPEPADVVLPEQEDIEDPGHPAKRQRLEDTDMQGDQALDDEAVLALAAHGEPGTGDAYTADFEYGEA